VFDPYLALGLNAVTFLVAAVVVAVGVRPRPAAYTASVDGEVRRGANGALRLIWKDRQLRWLIAVSWLVGFFVVPEALAAPYAASLGMATVAVGFLLTADPVGSIIGAWMVARIPDRSRTALINPLAVASGIPLAACVIQPGLVGSLLLWAVSGACSTAYLILAQASFTRRIPDHSRAAATGLASTGLYTSQGAAMLVGGLVADFTSPAWAIAGAGTTGAVLAGLVWASWRASRDSSDNRTGSKGGDTTTPHDVTSPYPSSSTPPPVEHAAEHGNRSAGSPIVTHDSGESSCT
jgi:hypothetical protein